HEQQSRFLLRVRWRGHQHLVNVLQRVNPVTAANSLKLESPGGNCERTNWPKGVPFTRSKSIPETTLASRITSLSNCASAAEAILARIQVTGTMRKRVFINFLSLMLTNGNGKSSRNHSLAVTWRGITSGTRT